MIEEIELRGLGVIEEAVLELGPGLTVVTGETGAGKTMVVTALNLLLGGRADSGLVRTGAGGALVQGRLRQLDEPVLQRAQDAGAELDEDGSLLMSRSVSAEGRSRAYVGGHAVPVGVLAELGEQLVQVHGQGDQQRLLRPAAQRAALDAHGGPRVTTLSAEVAALFADLRATERELDEVRDQRAERLAEAERLRFLLHGLERLAPDEGEDVALRAEAERLTHADVLRLAAESALLSLAGDEAAPEAPDALALVAAARRALEGVQQHDPALERLASVLADVGYTLADAAAELGAHLGSLDADPSRLEQVHERLAALSGAARERGVEDATGLLAWGRQAQERLLSLDDDDARVERLTAQARELRARLAAQAGALSAARQDVAEQLAATITAELRELAMPQAQVTVAVQQREQAGGLVVDGRELAFGPHGVDDVELQLTPHPGAPARALQRGASGGELSRVMLAVEVVLAGGAHPTYVFDEVDAGVGGKAAVEVGRRLARLARTAQVLVVTHLPQVAAFADRHLLVEKASDGSVTRSGVRRLDDGERVVELSRMLAGLEGSELALGHAEELLATAARSKTQV